MSASYRRVPGEEGQASNTSSGNGNGSNSSSNGQQRTTLTRTRSERFVDKMVAVAWVSAAAGVAYWTQFFQVILQLHDQNNKPEHHHQVNRPMLQLAAVGFGILVALTLYLTIYLPKVVGVKDSAAWDVYCPRVIPTMIIVAILTSLALVRATWPVWGFFAPLILALEAMGALFALHFIPSCA